MSHFLKKDERLRNNRERCTFRWTLETQLDTSWDATSVGQVLWSCRRHNFGKLSFP